MIQCNHCENSKNHEYYGRYAMSCYGCRQRLLLDDPCKVMREVTAKGMEKWGEIPEWKVEPNCGCKSECIRKKTMRINEEKVKNANKQKI